MLSTPASAGRAGLSLLEQFGGYPRRSVLISAMSAAHSYDLYEAEFKVERADRILLTTDGFHNKLMRSQIAEISASNPEFDAFWASLQDALSSEKLEDDASCLAVEIEP